MSMGCCNGGYHEFNLDWFIKRFNEIQEDWDGTKEWLKNWVDSFDISGEVKKVMQEWLDDGTFEELINQQVFGDINKKADQNTSDISALETRMTQAETDIGGNSTAIQSVSARVSTLEKRKPENIVGSRIIMIADSYGEFGCMEAFANTFNAVTVESKWVGGAGLTKTGEKSYITILNTLPDHDDIDYVILFGFYNDSFDVNGIADNFIAFKNRVQEKYPGSALVLVNQGWSSNVEYQGNFQYLFNILNGIIATNSGTIINTWNVLHNYAYMQSDQIHPTEAGGKRQGFTAARILMGGNPKTIYPIQQVVPTYINGWQKYGGTTEPYQEMNESECLLHFVSDRNHYGIDEGTTIKCDGQNYVEIFEFPDNKGCIIGSGDMLLNIPCILGDTVKKYYQASCTLEVYNKRLRIRPYMINATGNNFATINLNSVQFTPCTIRSNINHI